MKSFFHLLSFEPEHSWHEFRRENARVACKMCGLDNDYQNAPKDNESLQVVIEKCNEYQKFSAVVQVVHSHDTLQGIESRKNSAFVCEVNYLILNRNNHQKLIFKLCCLFQLS